ncbi:MAG: hypothetical protein NTW54_09740 [Bacteroidetes bacterium]|nr:hypothetical protein [Bacteroidota bacterium]
MKKNYLLLMAVILLCKVSDAQYYTFLTFGYNGGISNSKAVVNNFVKDYNDIRPYNTQKMNPQDYIQGFTGSWGWGSDGLFLDFMYTNKYSLQTAIGVPPSTGVLTRRDVRFTYNTLSVCMYFVNFEHKSFRGPGLSIDFGKMKQRTRVGDAGTLETTDYTDVGISKTLGLTLCYDYKVKIVKGVFLGFRPYYQFLRSEADILSIASTINKSFTGSSTKLKGGNYGVQLNLGFGTYHYN